MTRAHHWWAPGNDQRVTAYVACAYACVANENQVTTFQFQTIDVPRSVTPLSCWPVAKWQDWYDIRLIRNNHALLKVVPGLESADEPLLKFLLWSAGPKPFDALFGSNFPLPVSCTSGYSFVLRNIAQCFIFFMFLLAPAPLGIPRPTPSSPTSRTLPAPCLRSSHKLNLPGKTFPPVQLWGSDMYKSTILAASGAGGIVRAKANERRRLAFSQIPHTEQAARLTYSKATPHVACCCQCSFLLRTVSN